MRRRRIRQLRLSPRGIPILEVVCNHLQGVEQPVCDRAPQGVPPGRKPLARWELHHSLKKLLCLYVLNINSRLNRFQNIFKTIVLFSAFFLLAMQTGCILISTAGTVATTAVNTTVDIVGNTAETAVDVVTPDGDDD